MSEASRATSKAANPAAVNEGNPGHVRKNSLAAQRISEGVDNRQTPRSYWSRGPPDELEGATFAAHTADSRPGARSALVPRQVSPPSILEPHRDFMNSPRPSK